MGRNGRCSWDDRKRALNLDNHGSDFADIEEVFDGRFLLKREDTRRDYGEVRFNALVRLGDRIVDVTFNPRAGKAHLISVRPASREERKVYHAKAPQG